MSIVRRSLILLAGALVWSEVKRSDGSVEVQVFSTVNHLREATLSLHVDRNESKPLHITASLTFTHESSDYLLVAVLHGHEASNLSLFNVSSLNVCGRTTVHQNLGTIVSLLDLPPSSVPGMVHPIVVGTHRGEILLVDVLNRFHVSPNKGTVTRRTLGGNDASSLPSFSFTKPLHRHPMLYTCTDLARPHCVTALAFSEALGFLAVGDSEGRLFLFDLASRLLLAIMRTTTTNLNDLPIAQLLIVPDLGLRGCSVWVNMGTLSEPLRSLSKTRGSAALVSLLYFNLHHSKVASSSFHGNASDVPTVTRAAVRYQRRLGGTHNTAAPLLLQHLSKDGEVDERASFVAIAWASGANEISLSDLHLEVVDELHSRSAFPAAQVVDAQAIPYTLKECPKGWFVCPLVEKAPLTSLAILPDSVFIEAVNGLDSTSKADAMIQRLNFDLVCLCQSDVAEYHFESKPARFLHQLAQEAPTVLLPRSIERAKQALESARLLPTSTLVPLDLEGHDLPSYHVYSTLLYREQAHLIVELVRHRTGNGRLFAPSVDDVLGWADATLALLRERLHSIAKELRSDGKRSNSASASNRYHQFDLVCARLASIRSIYKAMLERDDDATLDLLALSERIVHVESLLCFTDVSRVFLEHQTISDRYDEVAANIALSIANRKESRLAQKVVGQWQRAVDPATMKPLALTHPRTLKRALSSLLIFQLTEPREQVNESNNGNNSSLLSFMSGSPRLSEPSDRICAYPPPSLQVLINMFLHCSIEDVHSAQTVLVYALLDLVLATSGAHTAQDLLKSNLASYEGAVEQAVESTTTAHICERLRIPVAYRRLAHAIWLLDHLAAVPPSALRLHEVNVTLSCALSDTIKSLQIADMPLGDFGPHILAVLVDLNCYDSAFQLVRVFSLPVLSLFDVAMHVFLFVRSGRYLEARAIVHDFVATQPSEDQEEARALLLYTLYDHAFSSKATFAEIFIKTPQTADDEVFLERFLSQRPPLHAAYLLHRLRYADALRVLLKLHVDENTRLLYEALKQQCEVILGMDGVAAVKASLNKPALSSLAHSPTGRLVSTPARAAPILLDDDEEIEEDAVIGNHMLEKGAVRSTPILSPRKPYEQAVNSRKRRQSGLTKFSVRMSLAQPPTPSSLPKASRPRLPEQNAMDIETPPISQPLFPPQVQVESVPSSSIASRAPSLTPPRALSISDENSDESSEEDFESSSEEPSELSNQFPVSEIGYELSDFSESSVSQAMTRAHPPSNSMISLGDIESREAESKSKSGGMRMDPPLRSVSSSGPSSSVPSFDEESKVSRALRSDVESEGREEDEEVSAKMDIEGLKGGLEEGRSDEDEQKAEKRVDIGVEVDEEPVEMVEESPLRRSDLEPEREIAHGEEELEVVNLPLEGDEVEDEDKEPQGNDMIPEESDMEVEESESVASADVGVEPSSTSGRVEEISRDSEPRRPPAKRKRAAEDEGDGQMAEYDEEVEKEGEVMEEDNAHKQGRGQHSDEEEHEAMEDEQSRARPVEKAKKTKGGSSIRMRRSSSPMAVAKWSTAGVGLAPGQPPRTSPRLRPIPSVEQSRHTEQPNFEQSDEVSLDQLNAEAEAATRRNHPLVSPVPAIRPKKRQKMTAETPFIPETPAMRTRRKIRLMEEFSSQDCASEADAQPREEKSARGDKSRENSSVVSVAKQGRKTGRPAKKVKRGGKAKLEALKEDKEKEDEKGQELEESESQSESGVRGARFHMSLRHRDKK